MKHRFNLIFILVVNVVLCSSKNINNSTYNLKLNKNGVFWMNNLLCNGCYNSSTCNTKGFYEIENNFIKLIPDNMEKEILIFEHDSTTKNEILKVDKEIFPFTMEVNEKIKIVKSKKELNKIKIKDSSIIYIYKSEFKPLRFMYTKKYQIIIKAQTKFGRGRLDIGKILIGLYQNNEIKFVLNNNIHRLKKIDNNNLFEFYTE